jgi:predicted nucleic acid-binding protein
MNYLDTSALIKRFVAERGSSAVRNLVEREGPIAVATVAYVELHAALARKRREGALSQRLHALICRQFERDWHSYLRVDLTDEILSRARDLVQGHPLRGLDAIHLASALMLKDALDGQIAFVGADQRQLQAAASEGLETVNVETSERP